jgi:hypothetical protein
MSGNRLVKFETILLVFSLAMTMINFTGCSNDKAASDIRNIKHFDETIWKSFQGSQEIKNPRAKMVADLKANYLKVGMKRAEVEAILGEADRISNGQYLYRLGMGQYSVDYSYMALAYNDVDILTAILSTRS